MTNKAPLITAQELMAKLQADPEYQAREARRALEIAERVEKFKIIEKPILEDLEKIGWNVNSVWDLVNTSQEYPTAIPVLLKHLVLPYPDAVREGIARALAVRLPEVKNAWALLVGEYLKAPIGAGVRFPGERELKLGYKDGLACALSVAVTEKTLPEYIAIVKDRTHGDSRVLLLSALRKSKNPIATQTLEELADDPDLKIAIADWKKKHKKK